LKSNPINAKNFMEFFESECGVEFVDTATGKRALDIINENRHCDTCYFAAKGDGKFVHIGDMICINADSEKVTCAVFVDTSCPQWTKKDGGGEG